MYTIHDSECIPFALVQPHQHVKPFGRPSTAKAARTEPLNLKVDDIAGTRTKQHCFATHPRLTNPVEPHYLWPRKHQPAPPAPKFIRNTLDTSDIVGSQARAPHTGRQQEHSIQLDCSDIEGARPQWQPEWKVAASARHASHRPASAPAHLRDNKAVRPINYVHDIAGSSSWHASNKDAHRLKVDTVQLAQTDHAEAQQLLQSKLGPDSTAAASALCRQLAKFDRECCGKIASSEFAAALQHSNLGLSSADVLRVANKLSDCHGLLNYRPITRMLQHCVHTHQHATSGKSESVATGRSALPPRQPLQSRNSNTVQLNNQPYINQVLCPASASDTASCTTGKGPVQQTNESEHNDKMQWQAVQQQQQQQRQQQQQQQQMLEQPEPKPQQSATTSAASVAAQAARTRQAKDFAVRVRPPASRPPYWFSKGIIGDMSKPYQWMPSGDTSTIGVGTAGSPHVRPWSAGLPPQTKHAMEAEHHLQQLQEGPHMLPAGYRRPQSAKLVSAAALASQGAEFYC